MLPDRDPFHLDQEIDPTDIASFLASLPPPSGAGKLRTPPPKRVLPSPKSPQKFTDNIIRRAAEERLRREREALRLFEPLPVQQEFLDSKAYIRLLLGGNRCLGGETLIYDPVAKVNRRIDSIKDDFHVRSANKRTGDLEKVKVARPFIKAREELYRYTLSNGEWFVATRHHLVQAASGRWVNMRKASSGMPLTEYPAFDEDSELTVVSEEFLRVGEVWDIEVPPHDNYIIGGVCHHNSGKTLTGAYECARIVTNQAGDDYAKSGLFVVVGRDFDVIGQGIYPNLCEPGAFKVITDPVTKELRAFRPDAEWDAANKHLVRMSDPLIPERLIKKRGWINKARKQIARITLHTGWTILFFSGDSNPKPGFKADFAWIDEEIQNGAWVAELRSRLVDRRGRMYWTATPENSTPTLYDLWCHYLDGSKDIKAWTISTENHRHHSAEARAELLVGITDTNYATKVRGEFRLGSALVFPEFVWPKVSCKRFEIPSHWTRYLVLDPGFNPASLLLAAVPPPKPIAETDTPHCGKVYIYDEIIVTECSAEKLATTVKERVGKTAFQRFIIDYQGSQSHQLGPGLRIIDQYQAAFKAHGLESTRQGATFTHGLNDPMGRINAIREWLHGTSPTLRVFEHCNTLRSQMERYHFARDRNNVLTEKPVQKHNHLIDCLGMLAAYDPGYHAPDPRIPTTAIQKLLASKRKLKGTTGQNGGITFGPSS